MFCVNKIPSLSLMTAGSLDWFTTIIGIVHFGALEGNPFMAHLISSNLFVFSLIKLLTTVAIGYIFYKAKKILLLANNQSSKAFRFTSLGLKATYLGATFVLVFAVINNIFVVVQAV